MGDYVVSQINHHAIHATYAPNCICIQISVFYFILQLIFHITNIIASLSDYLGLHLIFFSHKGPRQGRKKSTSVGECPGEHEMLCLDKPLN